MYNYISVLALIPIHTFLIHLVWKLFIMVHILGLILPFLVSGMHVDMHDDVCYNQSW